MSFIRVWLFFTPICENCDFIVPKIHFEQKMEYLKYLHYW